MSFRDSSFVVRCCKFGMVVQAILINVTPPLFIPLKEEFGLSFEQIGRLIAINFSTQVIFDLLCGYLVDRLGPKPFASPRSCWRLRGCCCLR
jgi:MFS family permease